MMHRLACMAFALCCQLLAAPAHAHLMPAGHGTINIVAADAYLVFSFPAAAFRAADKNGDGLLDGAELQAGRDRIGQHFRRGMDLRSGSENATWMEVMSSLPARADHPDAPSSELMVMAVARFSRPPRTLEMRSRLWGEQSAVIKVRATISQGASTLASETGLISNRHPDFAFFAPAPVVLGTFMRLGAEHILAGLDHLLFLVALLAAAIEWRRWCYLLTAFTLAHGCTFALASLGWISLPAALIEPLIAASIVAISAMYLMKWQPALWREAVLVFGVGLVHGLGFAAAMQEHGLNGAHPALSIVGFNLGVELAQLLVALMLYLALLLLRRLPRLGAVERWQRGGAIASGLAGAIWIVQRTIFA